MKFLIPALLILLPTLLPLGTTQAATLLGPTAYLSVADSPLAGLSGYSYFHLEDFEDGLFNSPGVSVNTAGTTIAGPSIYTDSVDGDDGSIDGVGQAGHSQFNGSGAVGLTYTFSEAVLGNLPTHAGLVWTDGLDSVLFEAFDAFGVSLGSVGPANISDGNGIWTGETGEDRFFGIISNVGIGSIRITGGGGAGIEVDHLQYGHMSDSAPVPAPSSLALLLSVGLLGLRYTSSQGGGSSSLTLSGLRSGTDYFLQLFLSNSVNSTGKASRVTVQGSQHNISNFGSTADYLNISFTASGTSELISFGTGSTGESARMILNAYSLSGPAATSVPLPTPVLLMGLGLAALSLRKTRTTQA